jgi:hypothetical protein
VAADTAPLIGIAAGAVVAALGFVAKTSIESWRGWRRAEAKSRAQLLKLQALLQAGQTAFLVQRALASRLETRLKAAQSEIHGSSGLERLFADKYHVFGPEERELHGIIRAYTEHALHPINSSLATWLDDDDRHRVEDRKKSENELRLAKLLNRLDAHLLLWLAKYEGWIPGRPDHALVYLADEEEHGVTFPKGLEEAAAAVLAERV